MSEPIVDLLEAEWGALVELGESFTDEHWATPTELPGWSVKDCYSHIAGTERMLQGEPVPEVDLSGLEHLTAPSALLTEPAVAARRPLAGVAVLDELRTVADERVRELRAMSPAQFDEVGPSPVGHVAYREFMAVRAFDSWMHEQDVRRALALPGHTEGPVAEHSLGRCIKALGFVVGKKAGAPEGSSVVFDIAGPLARTLTVTVRDGRAHTEVAAPTGSPTVHLALDAQTLWCLCGGRWDPETTLTDGLITFDGDRELGEAVVRSLNIMI